MIRDKLTPELKKRFIEDINITIQAGKERGFFLCENKEGKLIGSESCEGTECELNLGNPIMACPSETFPFGHFHTHPYMYETKKYLKKRGEKIPPDSDLKVRFNKNIKDVHEQIGVKNITVNSPSYSDLLQTLLGKAKGITKGYVCTATDVEPDRVECWSIKDMDKEKLNTYAAYGIEEILEKTPEKSSLIKKWIDDISIRETINLK